MTRNDGQHKQHDQRRIEWGFTFLGETPANWRKEEEPAESDGESVEQESFPIAMAYQILMADATAPVSTGSEAKLMNRETNTYLCNLPVGSRGRIVGYEQVTGGYKGRLLAMGLTPGTEFTVICYAPLDDLIEIEVRGCLLSLCKHEADVLCIEEVGDE